jgi:D-alanyl-D-alanine carboxypeptidase
MKHVIVVGLVVAIASAAFAGTATRGASAFEARAEQASEPVFGGTISRIDAELRERMTSWRPGCPVPLHRLRVLKFNRWGFDGELHRGWLIVNEYQSRPVLAVMRKLFETRFPFRSIRLIDAYGSDDRRSMAANNTSAFNCRYVAGTTRWSEHAYGRAIDINPVQNPYVQGSYVSPPAGRAYVDRSKRAPGMIHTRDVVVRAFASIGWEWGGYWGSAKDYQHFSSTGH